MRSPAVAVVVRMPTALRDAVKAKAATEERSMAQAIRYALRQYVDNVTPEKTPGEGPEPLA